MKALMKKDFYQILSQFKLIAVMILFFTAVPDGRFIPFAVIYSILVVSVSLQSMDEQSSWDSLALMLPYTRRELVVEKYVIGWLSLAGTLVLGAAFQLLWGALGVSDRPGTDYLSLLCVYTAMALVFQAVTNPLSFRFGHAKGRIISILLISLSVGVITAVTVVAATEEVFDTVLVPLQRVHAAAYPLLAAALCAASIPLSVRGYVKRVEK